jgi:hypothetical protein
MRLCIFDATGSPKAFHELLERLYNGSISDGLVLAMSVATPIF